MPVCGHIGLEPAREPGGGLEALKERWAAEFPGVRGSRLVKDAWGEGIQEAVTVAVFKAALIAWRGGQQGDEGVRGRAGGELWPFSQE